MQLRLTKISSKVCFASSSLTKWLVVARSAKPFAAQQNLPSFLFQMLAFLSSEFKHRIATWTLNIFYAPIGSLTPTVRLYPVRLFLFEWNIQMFLFLYIWFAVQHSFSQLLISVFSSQSNSHKIHIWLTLWFSVYRCHGNIDFPKNNIVPNFNHS